jgi:hypothetical protein
LKLYSNGPAQVQSLLMAFVCHSFFFGEDTKFVALSLISPRLITKFVHSNLKWNVSNETPQRAKLCARRHHRHPIHYIMNQRRVI